MNDCVLTVCGEFAFGTRYGWVPVKKANLIGCSCTPIRHPAGCDFAIVKFDRGSLPTTIIATSPNSRNFEE